MASKDEGKLLAKLPTSFIQFLKDNEVDPEVFVAADDLPRYIRRNPRKHVSEKVLTEELGTSLLAISWLDGFFGLDGEVMNLIL